jgi:hypothetical protein
MKLECNWESQCVFHRRKKIVIRKSKRDNVGLALLKMIIGLKLMMFIKNILISWKYYNLFMCIFIM